MKEIETENVIEIEIESANVKENTLSAQENGRENAIALEATNATTETCVTRETTMNATLLMKIPGESTVAVDLTEKKIEKEME